MCNIFSYFSSRPTYQPPSPPIPSSSSLSQPSATLPPSPPPFDQQEIENRIRALQEQVASFLQELRPPTKNEKKRVQEVLEEYSVLKEHLWTPTLEKDLIKFYCQYDITIIIDPITSGGIASANPLSRRIYLYPLFLLKPEDIPSELKENESINIQKLKIWISEKFKIKEETLTLNNFHFFLELWKNPKTLEKVKNFLLAHETAHIHHNHFSPFWDITFSICVTALVAIFLWNTTSLLTTILVSFLVLQIASIVFRYFHMYYYRYHEKEADLTALRLVKNNIIGPKVFFETVNQIRSEVWKSLSFYSKAYYFILQPELVFHLSHPSEKERMTYLEPFSKA